MRPRTSVAVLVPCLNEAVAIQAVVEGFRASLGDCQVYVYDNGSADNTADLAREAGAVVRHELRPGKGNVVRRMFADVDADVYVMADGDGTYDPAEAPTLIDRLLDDGLDMVVGVRQGLDQRTNRFGHVLGNRAFNRLYRFLFGAGFTDILSGFRAFSRRFVKSFPGVASGFEIETEMSVHASQLALPVAEVPVTYRGRPVGSTSKLRTIRDGVRILRTMIVLLKDNRPGVFFGWLSAVNLAGSLLLGIPIVVSFAQTGLVERLPSAVLATGMMMVGLLLWVLGRILDSVSIGRIEAKRLLYLLND